MIIVIALSRQFWVYKRDAFAKGGVRQRRAAALRSLVGTQRSSTDMGRPAATLGVELIEPINLGLDKLYPFPLTVNMGYHLVIT